VCLQKAHHASVKASVHCFSAPLYPHMSPPLSSPSILAAMISLAHHDVWLIVAVLANPPIFILLKLKCYSVTADLKLHC